MARSAPRTVRYGVIEWYPSGIGLTAKANFFASFITASPFFPGTKPRRAGSRHEPGGVPARYRIDPLLPSSDLAGPSLDVPLFLVDSPGGKIRRAPHQRLPRRPVDPGSFAGKPVPG